MGISEERNVNCSYATPNYILRLLDEKKMLKKPSVGVTQISSSFFKQTKLCKKKRRRGEALQKPSVGISLERNVNCSYAAGLPIKKNQVWVFLFNYFFFL